VKNTIRSSLRTLAAVLLAAMPSIVVGAPPVQVNAADPSSAPQGTMSLDVTVSGSGFDSSAQVDFLVTGTTNPGGVIVRNVRVTGPKKLVATIDVADTAVIDKFDIQVSLSGGRKGKGTSLFAVLTKTNDACANALNFPSFVYVEAAGQSATRVADQTGKCTRLLMNELPSLDRVFSYPVMDDEGNPTNRGRVVWRGPAPGTLPTSDQKLHAMDFTVAGTTITPGPVYLVVNFGPVSMEGGGNGGVCCGLDLSVDGRDLYLPTKAELRIEGYVNKVARIRLPGDLADLDPNNPPTQTIVFEHVAGPRNDTQYTTELDVNVANDLLFIEQFENPERRLLRVDLDPDLVDTGGNQEAVVIAQAQVGGNMHVGTDHSDPGSDLVGVANYSFEAECYFLSIINGRTGTVLNEGTEWPASSLSWANGKVLTSGFRRGCRSLTTIVEINPLNGATTTLLTGGGANGR